MMNNRKTIVVTSGEPGGIGPDICLDIPGFTDINAMFIVIGDRVLLENRATMLKKSCKIIALDFEDLSKDKILQPDIIDASFLYVLHVECPNHETVGQLKVENVAYVLKMLDIGISLCENKLAAAVITAPVSKEIINKSGVEFSGHTEYFASKFGVKKVVMMLANSHMKVALLTTHLPLKDVTSNITQDNLNQALQVIINTFQHQFKVANPKVAVCGLNPHAGEGGYLGDEEITIINPVIKTWQDRGYLVSGTHPADTIFTKANEFDVILAMYHDQGLPVLKYAEFESGVNITLGLPIIRVSVDHGTALDIAGSGKASSGSLHCAIKWASRLIV